MSEVYEVNNLFTGDPYKDCGFHNLCCGTYKGCLCDCGEVKEKNSMFMILWKQGAFSKMRESLFEMIATLCSDDKQKALAMLLSIITVANDWLSTGITCELPKIQVPSDEEASEFLLAYRKRCSPRK